MGVFLKKENLTGNGHGENVTSFRPLLRGDAGEHTAPGREEQVQKATLENESGRTINVTWEAVGGLFKNKIVTKHAPLLRRMMGASDTYQFDKCIAKTRRRYPCLRSHDSD